MYRLELKKQVDYVRPEVLISESDLECLIAQGEKLVVLDDLVLDVSAYMKFHPGGAFLVEHNLGRDISKFFYGGYALENDRGQKGFAHSNLARKIVNELAIGIMYREAEIVHYQIDHIKTVKINDKIRTINFKAKTQPIIAGVQQFYSELAQFGKHYIVQAVTSAGQGKVVSRLSPKRHYTIANCMGKAHYYHYM